jgi:hypothetical protein
MMIKDKHTLTPKYLLINYAWSLVLFAISLMAWHDDSLLNTERGRYYLIIITAGLLLFPFARFCIEKIALQFSTKKFWTSGFFQDDAGQNGVRALFYLFCFVMAIPFGLGYLLYRGIQKCGLVRPHKIR